MKEKDCKQNGQHIPVSRSEAFDMLPQATRIATMTGRMVRLQDRCEVEAAMDEANSIGCTSLYGKAHLIVGREGQEPLYIEARGRHGN